jgi:hypothetical protein
MYLNKFGIVIPFSSSPQEHPSKTELIGLYIKHTDNSHEYINITHPDEAITDVDISSIVFNEKTLIFNKKVLMYNGIFSGIDLNSYMNYYFDDTIDQFEFYPKTMDEYLTKYYYLSDNLKVLPLSKLIEYADNISEYILKYYKPENISQKCINYCNDFSSVFYQIEKNTILMENEHRFQNYMWYTLTNRPSNTWNNINFSALNKTDGTRNKIKSRFENGKIVQFDYDAFHLKLLSKILDYKFDKHPYDEIREKLELNIDYDTIKLKVFQNIYGTMLPEFIKHPLFKKIKEMIDSLYREYTLHGKIDSWFYKKKFRGIQDPTPTKIFNYMLQSLETEYNVRKIKALLPLLDDKQSKLMLYLYDAFVFDIHPDEIYLIDILKNAFQTDEMTIKLYVGNDFGSIKQI